MTETKQENPNSKTVFDIYVPIIPIQTPSPTQGSEKNTNVPLVLRQQHTQITTIVQRRQAERMSVTPITGGIRQQFNGSRSNTPNQNLQRTPQTVNLNDAYIDSAQSRISTNTNTQSLNEGFVSYGHAFDSGNTENNINTKNYHLRRITQCGVELEDAQADCS